MRQRGDVTAGVQAQDKDGLFSINIGADDEDVELPYES
jgi:hypothetical protein